MVALDHSPAHEAYVVAESRWATVQPGPRIAQTCRQMICCSDAGYQKRVNSSRSDDDPARYLVAHSPTERAALQLTSLGA
jgi:hypothetical protein